MMDSNGYRWAKHMKRLLQATCQVVAKQKSKKLTDQEYANLQKRYRTMMTRGEHKLPPIPTKAKGKRGKVAKSAAHHLWERLSVQEEAVL